MIPERSSCTPKSQTTPSNHRPHPPLQEEGAQQRVVAVRSPFSCGSFRELLKANVTNRTWDVKGKFWRVPLVSLHLLVALMDEFNLPVEDNIRNQAAAFRPPAGPAARVAPSQAKPQSPKPNEVVVNLEETAGVVTMRFAYSAQAVAPVHTSREYDLRALRPLERSQYITIGHVSSHNIPRTNSSGPATHEQAGCASKRRMCKQSEQQASGLCVSATKERERGLFSKSCERAGMGHQAG
eukprot:193429-Prorocentrum_minimum.AAC.4